jgi:hypothetical protein
MKLLEIFPKHSFRGLDIVFFEFRLTKTEDFALKFVKYRLSENLS